MLLFNGGNRKYMVFVHISRYDMVSTPVGRAKFRYQKKLTHNIEIQKL